MVLFWEFVADISDVFDFMVDVWSGFPFIFRLVFAISFSLAIGLVLIQKMLN